MKKITITLLIGVIYTLSFAQIKVGPNGNVAMGLSIAYDSVQSPLTIGGPGDLTSFVSVSGSNLYGIKINNGGASSLTGLLSHTTGCGSSTTVAVGIQGEGAYLPGYCPGKGVGVRGLSGGGPLTSNAIGVSGLLAGTNSGAGIYGAYAATSEASISGQYAGYFNGNTTVTNGTLSATLTSSSDKRLKENISDADAEKTISNLLQLRPIEYNYAQADVEVEEYDENGNVSINKVPMFDEKSDVFLHKHYGLIAQELKEVYPDLVYTRPDGYLSINYVELIPMLLTAIQTQQKELETIKSQLEETSKTRKATEIEDLYEVSQTALFQNQPNPFTEKTTITCYLQQTVVKADLYIFDLTGKMVSTYPLNDRENVAIEINGNSLQPGMYQYSLVADGKIIDTKKMLLTK